MSQRSWTLALTTLIAACASDPEPSVGAIEGTYYGDFTLGHDDPSQSVFASAQLVVDGSGDLGASTFTSKSPTRTVGEVATAAGMIESLGGTGIDVTLEVAFPTLGTFTATGNAMYFDTTGNLAGQLITRDGTGAFVGMTVLNVTKDR